MAEIRKAHELLVAASRFRPPQAAAWLLPLHSSVSAEQQRRVFQVLLGPPWQCDFCHCSLADTAASLNASNLFCPG